MNSSKLTNKAPEVGQIEILLLIVLQFYAFNFLCWLVLMTSVYKAKLHGSGDNSLFLAFLILVEVSLLFLY